MSDTFDLILASYETLDVARQDFDELVTLVTNKRLERGHPAPDADRTFGMPADGRSAWVSVVRDFPELPGERDFAPRVGWPTVAGHRHAKMRW